MICLMCEAPINPKLDGSRNFKFLSQSHRLTFCLGCAIKFDEVINSKQDTDNIPENNKEKVKYDA